MCPKFLTGSVYSPVHFETDLKERAAFYRLFYLSSDRGNLFVTAVLSASAAELGVSKAWRHSAPFDEACFGGSELSSANAQLAR